MFFYNEQESQISMPEAPSIVSADLIMRLDAGDINSYPGTGTTWTDLSGLGNDATLVGGVSYSSDAGGSLFFDGIDDYVDAGSVMPTGDFSISFWYNGDYTVPSEAALFGLGVNGQSNSFIFYVNTNFGNANSQIRIFSHTSELMIGSSIDNTGWRFITVTREGTTYNLYLDTVLDNSNTRSGALSQSLRIGGFSGISRFLVGNIGSALLYSKALSAAEIQQNYDALKSRFGL